MGARAAGFFGREWGSEMVGKAPATFAAIFGPCKGRAGRRCFLIGRAAREAQSAVGQCVAVRRLPVGRLHSTGFTTASGVREPEASRAIATEYRVRKIPWYLRRLRILSLSPSLSLAGRRCAHILATRAASLLLDNVTHPPTHRSAYGVNSGGAQGDEAWLPSMRQWPVQKGKEGGALHQRPNA